MNDFNKETFDESDKRRLKRHNRRVDIVAIIVCLLAAVGIWVYASNNQPAEKTPESGSGNAILIVSGYGDFTK